MTDCRFIGAGGKSATPNPAIAPRATSSIQVQVKSVHSEFVQNSVNDSNRLDAVWKSTARPGHPLRKFGSGNKNSLGARKGVSREGVMPRARLLSHWRSFYSPDRMTLAVLGKEDLDTLEKWVVQDFSTVRCCMRGCTSFFERLIRDDGHLSSATSSLRVLPRIVCYTSVISMV
jgi:secreted Zn-dependent insulinase-like peptidase